MNYRLEKTIGIIAVVGCTLGLVILYIVGPDNFSDPVSVEYIAKVVLYPSGLLAIRFAWKSLLDNKIRSKSEREEGFKREMEEFNDSE